MKKILLYILSVSLILKVQAQDGSIKKFGIGGQINQYQNDFGIGLNFSSPYLGLSKMAIRLKGNLMWNQHINQSDEWTWSPYSNLSIGFVQTIKENQDLLRIYVEGGSIFLFPSENFSTKSIVFGGYGLFGFEFILNKHANYFIEIGGVGTGANADKINAKPIYSNGLLIGSGVRLSL